MCNFTFRTCVRAQCLLSQDTLITIVLHILTKISKFGSCKMPQIHCLSSFTRASILQPYQSSPGRGCDVMYIQLHAAWRLNSELNTIIQAHISIELNKKGIVCQRKQYTARYFFQRYTKFCVAKAMRESQLYEIELKEFYQFTFLSILTMFLHCYIVMEDKGSFQLVSCVWVLSKSLRNVLQYTVILKELYLLQFPDLTQEIIAIHIRWAQ